MVEHPVGAGDGDVRPGHAGAGLRPGADEVPAGGEDHGAVRRLAEDQDEDRGGERGKVRREREEGEGGVRGGAGDEQEGFWGGEGEGQEAGGVRWLVGFGWRFTGF